MSKAITRNSISIKDVFGQWTVISEPFYVHNGFCNRTTVKCRCSCGTIKDIVLAFLISGKTTCCKECFHKNKRKGTLASGNKKTCSDCLQELTIDKFRKHKITQDGLRPRCRECDYFADIEREYNLTRSEYEELLRNQNGCCALCNNPFGDEKPHIDHCHETGLVRGLCHGRCNRAFGLLDESPTVFRNGLEYAKKWSKVKESYKNG